jgi:hypothetical protein
MERLTWWLADIRYAIEHSSDAKFVGVLALVAVLAGGGYLAAHEVSHTGAAKGALPHRVRLVTMREPAKKPTHAHTIIRWRAGRKVVETQGHTVMQTETVQTPAGMKVITHPVDRFQVVYRKKVVTKNGKTSTVVVPQTVTNSQTSTVLRTQTAVRTVTQPVTVVETRTVVSTVTLPGTTVTLPGTTVTVPLPTTTG